MKRLFAAVGILGGMAACSNPMAPEAATEASVESAAVLRTQGTTIVLPTLKANAKKMMGAAKIGEP